MSRKKKKGRMLQDNDKTPELSEEEILESIKSAKMDPEDDHLNALLDDPQKEPVVEDKQPEPKILLLGMGIRHLWGTHGKESMEAIARLFGYEPHALVSSGENQYDSPQTVEAIEFLRHYGKRCGGMIGFSGGAWNMRNITKHPSYKKLPQDVRESFQGFLMAIGAPIGGDEFPKGSNYMHYNLPNVAHLDQPQRVYEYLKKQFEQETGPTS